VYFVQVHLTMTRKLSVMLCAFFVRRFSANRIALVLCRAAQCARPPVKSRPHSSRGLCMAGRLTDQVIEVFLMPPLRVLSLLSSFLEPISLSF
jgi:hypothetical protein